VIDIANDREMLHERCLNMRIKV